MFGYINSGPEPTTTTFSDNQSIGQINHVSFHVTNIIEFSSYNLFISDDNPTANRAIQKFSIYACTNDTFNSDNLVSQISISTPYASSGIRISDQFNPVKAKYFYLTFESASSLGPRIVRLEANTVPFIARQPQDVQLSASNTQTVTFSVGVTNGVPPYSYQWMKDGVDLTNQTNASLVLSNAGANTVGYYSCDVTDANGTTVTSSNAALNITGVPFGLWQGLVGYWPLNGDAMDAGMHSFNGTTYNLQVCADRFGNSQSALYFNGNSGYVDIGNHNEFNFGYSNFSITSWVKFDNDCHYAYIISKYLSDQRGSYGLGTTDLSSYSFLYGSQDCGAVDGQFNLKDNKWHCIVASYNRTSLLNVFIDGKLDSSVDIQAENQFQSNNLSLMVGRLAEGSSFGPQWFKGCISDIRIYNRALSSNEVATLYALESTDPRQNQSITFSAIPPLTLTNGSYSLGATADSGLPVSYAIGDSSIAAITSGSLIPLGVGTTTVVATQAGDTNYLPATPVTNPLVITYATQDYSSPAIATRTYGSLPFGLTLPTNSSGLPVTARIVSGPATLSGTNLTITGTGTVTLAYDAPGNSLYASNSVTNSFAVTNGPTNLKSQMITFKALSAATFGGKAIAPSATATSKLPVTFWSSNTNVAVVSGTNIVITGAGQSVITAYQPGDGSTWNPATPASQTLIVNQASQKLTFKGPAKLTYSSSVTLSGSSSMGLPVLYTCSDSNVARLSTSGTNTLLTPVGTGMVTVTATQPGNANVTAATPIAQPVVIAPGAQTLTFTLASTNAVYGDAPITLSATSSAGLPVTFAVTPANVASVSGNTLTITGAGKATITASQSGSSLWAAVKPVTKTLAVAKASQTISLSLPSSVTYTNGGLLSLGGTASSGLPVAYKSGNAKVLTIAGTNCLITGKGTTTVVATQPGNANYLAAPAVTNTVTVR